MGVGDDGALSPPLYFRCGVAGRWLFTEFMLYVPEKIVRGTGGTRVVWAGFVNNGQFQIAGLRLSRTRYSHMHAIGFTVSIGVKFGFHPESVTNPVFRILKFRDDLSLPVFNHRDLQVLILSGEGV